MKKILLPTNFSEKAGNAARYAIRLFQQEPARFMLVNAYNLSCRPTEIRISALQGGIGAAAKKSLIELQHQLSKEIRQYGAAVTGTAVFGNTSRVIRDFAHTHRVDAIVLGAEEKRTRRRLFSGSPTRHLLQKPAWPVVIVPEEARFREPEQIFLLNDLQRPVADSPMQELLRIIERYDSTVTVLNLVNQSTLRRAEQQVGELKAVLGEALRNFYFLPEHEAHDGLRKLMQQQSPDMIALQGGSGFINKLYKTWSAGRAGAFSDHPLLVNYA